MAVYILVVKYTAHVQPDGKFFSFGLTVLNTKTYHLVVFEFITHLSNGYINICALNSYLCTLFYSGNPYSVKLLKLVHSIVVINLHKNGLGERGVEETQTEKMCRVNSNKIGLENENSSEQRD